MVSTGPDIADGAFKPAAVKSIHYKRLPVGQVVAGQTAALALKKIKRSQVRHSRDGALAKRGRGVSSRCCPEAALWRTGRDLPVVGLGATPRP
jgi:hypothetical protein